MATRAGTSDDRWIALVAVLPTDDPAARMRVLRTIEAMGAASLREGVYLLPDSTSNRSSLASLREHISRLGGIAHVLPVSSEDAEQKKAFLTLFDRGAQYENLRKNIESLDTAIGHSAPESISIVLARQRKEFEAISELEFFPSAEREVTLRALESMEQRIKSALFPTASNSRASASMQRRFTERCWATKTPLWMDRLASAWLIQRHIDPGGSILCLEKDQRCPASAISFGYDGAQFCNSDSQVTYESLLANFGLAKDARLVKIGTLVRCLHGVGTAVSAAAGVERLIEGARRRSKSNEDLLAECGATFDLLVDAYAEPAVPKD